MSVMLTPTIVPKTALATTQLAHTNAHVMSAMRKMASFASTLTSVLLATISALLILTVTTPLAGMSVLAQLATPVMLFPFAKMSTSVTGQ